MLGSTSTTKLPPTGARTKSSSPTDAVAHHQLGRQPERERAHDQVRGQEREADLERLVVQHELEIERREEEPREHRSGPEHADDVRGGEVPQPEEAERHQR